MNSLKDTSDNPVMRQYSCKVTSVDKKESLRKFYAVRNMKMYSP